MKEIIPTFDDYILESLNTEQLNIVNNYLNLKKAIDDPNYHDTAHTRAALIAAKKKVKELIKSNSLRRDVLAMLTPSDVDDITNESYKLNEVRYQILHPTYSSAVQAAREEAELQGFTVPDEDWFKYVNMGEGKPDPGKTTKHILPLIVTKTGKPSKKTLAIQVYNRGVSGNTFELNMYIS